MAGYTLLPFHQIRNLFALVVRVCPPGEERHNFMVLPPQPVNVAHPVANHGEISARRKRGGKHAYRDPIGGPHYVVPARGGSPRTMPISS